MPGGGKGLRRQQLEGRRSPETAHSESDATRRSDAAPGPGP